MIRIFILSFLFINTSFAQMLCHPIKFDCVEYACQKLGRLACDELVELQEIHKLCRDQADTPCMSNLCLKLGNFGCDSLDELQDVAQVCLIKPNLNCVEDTCRRLGAFSCNDLSKLKSITEMCSNI